MAGIDYTIPQQFKGVQIEPPENAMMRAMQMRGLQDTMEMNALKKQEYQRAREEENAVRNWFASGKKLDSPEALNELYKIAPGAASGIEKSMLERSKTQAEIGYKKAQTGYEDIKARKEQLDFTDRALQRSTTPDAARAHIQQAANLGYLTPEAATQMVASVPNDLGQFENWRMNLLAHSMTAKDQLERMQALRDKEYNDYLVKATFYGEDALSPAEYFAKQQPSAPAANVGETSPTAFSAQATETADGEKVLPGFTKKVPAISGISPFAMQLYAHSKDGVTKFAEAVQAAQVEEDKRTQLTGDTANAVNAQIRIDEIKAAIAKDPSKNTPENRNLIKVLEDQKRALAQGRSIPVQPAPTVTMVLDPNDPTRMLSIDARQYRGGSVGSQGVIGVAGKEPTVGKKQDAKEIAQENAATTIAQLRQSFDQLDRLGGITSTNNRAGTNLAAGISSSGAGQVVGRLLGTEVQSERNKIAQTRPLLMTTIMQAMGLSAKQLDSNAELKLWLSAATDPTLDLEANRAALNNLERMLTGKGKPAPTKPAGAIKAPAVGTVKDGYRFKGGNPADQNSWEKVK